MKGFTFVELVVVIILLGVLSVTALARFASPNAYTPEALSQAIAQQLRFAAQGAQAMNGTFVTEVSQSAGEWRIQVRRAGVLERSVEIDVANSTLSVNGSAVDTSIAWLVTHADSGGLSSATLGSTALDPTAGLQLLITGDSNRTLCIYPTGHVSERACV